MKLSLVLQHLLLFISVLPLTNQQPTPFQTTLPETTTPDLAATTTMTTTTYPSENTPLPTSTVPPDSTLLPTTTVPTENTPLPTTTVPPVVATTSAQPWTAPAIFYPFGSAVGDTELNVNYDINQYLVTLSTPFSFFGRTYNSLYVLYNGLLAFTLSPEIMPDANPFIGTDDFIAPLWNDYDDYYLGMISFQQYTDLNMLVRASQDVNQHFSTTNFQASWVFVVTWNYASQPNPTI
nr:sushi, nidogen and EGF-like domain-containing protein 1 [Danio rerio]|eukprot:XP_021335853.1 sushi, nidogen and EGF-like domain-containing protein 1 [Danio rerio]